MSEPTPDYVGRPYQPVHGALPSNYQWQAMSQDQIEGLRKRLIESIIQVIVQAITGIFIPGGEIGGAASQLTEWATDIATAALSGIESIVHALTGQAGGLELLSPLSWLFPGLINNADGTFSSVLEDLFVDNGDGTWSFIENGIHTIIDVGDGILTSPISLLQNVLGQLGTFQATMNRQQSIIDNLFNAINYTDVIGNEVGALLDALRNIPGLNVLGTGGPVNIAETVLATWNQWIGGLVGAVGTGAGLADLFNIGQEISSRATLGLLSWDTLGIRSNKPLWGGMLPTGVANIPMPALNSTTAPTIPVTQTNAVMGYHPVDESSVKSAVGWEGSITGTLTHFFINIYKINQTTGLRTLVHASPNIAGDISAPLGANVYSFTDGLGNDTPINVVATEVYGIEHAVRGTGTYNIIGAASWRNFDHPTVLPKRMASWRNSGTSAAPATIDEATFAAGSTAGYSANIPVAEFAVSAGMSNIHSPDKRQFLTVGNHSTTVPTWADFAEVVVLGPGGNGYNGSGTVGINGRGGGAGSWATATWQRGVHFSAGDIINIHVAPSSGTTSVTVGANSVTGAPGFWGSGWGVPSVGAGPGNQTYGTETYVGGYQQGNLSANGAAPGGGGSGGVGGFGFAPGGTGAPGAAWIRFKQGSASGHAGYTAAPAPVELTLTTYAPTVITAQEPSTATLTLTTYAPNIIVSNYVTRDGTTGNLMLSGRRFRFSGANTPYDIGSVNDGNGVRDLYGGSASDSSRMYITSHSQIDAVLDSAIAMNANVIRAFSAVLPVGSANTPQPSIGVYNDAALDPMDYLLKRCAELDLRIVVPLVNEYDGRPWYASQNGVAAAAFYTDTNTINSFKAYVAHLLDRVNPYTGIAYKDDPRILAWETGNELTGSSTTLNSWTDTISTYIKVTKGAKQLVMDGRLGFTSDGVTYDTAALNLTNVDIYSDHSYDQWRTPTWIVNEATQAHSHGKAFIEGEWAWTDGPNWTMAQMISAIEGSTYVDGDAFWALLAPPTAWNDGYTLHWPGDTADMISRATALATHAQRMSGLVKPGTANFTLTTSAPTIPNINDVDGGDFTTTGTGSLDGGNFTGTGAGSTDGGSI